MGYCKVVSILSSLDRMDAFIDGGIKMFVIMGFRVGLRRCNWMLNLLRGFLILILLKGWLDLELTQYRISHLTHLNQ